MREYAFISSEENNRIIKVILKIVEYELLDANMETMKLQSHIGTDGILQIQTPTDLKDTLVEVVVIIQPLPNAEVATSSEAQVQYNAWGKPTTKKSISNAIARMQELRRQVALDKTSLRSMIEEGRRF
ncbi:hypothetical protein [Nostoc sp. LEGE 06077]|uniref:hypothetical protein n=1 Tax=Nostoc sp. LEGE 06077 TaxID=915325 RepID=UPI002AD241D7|nr:hypothetical protein [Nostoc sp. LEGE 06077]